MGFDTSELRAFIARLEKAKLDARQLSEREVNRITDRHLARCKQNTSIGPSPYSPTLRDGWGRSAAFRSGGRVLARVFNPVYYASWYEFGHRQTPGRVIFVELRPGKALYGIPAKKVTSGRHKGKWGVFLRLKQPRVKGQYVMTKSEEQARKELDAAARKIEETIRKGLG